MENSKGAVHCECLLKALGLMFDLPLQGSTMAVAVYD